MTDEILNNKTVLITGGTGSFGNAVVRRFLRSDVHEIRIFSRDEKKQDDMRAQFADKRLKFYLGDVRHHGSVVEAMKGTNLVFHAAALKQVPSCEFHPMEAVRTNVLGAENVIAAAIECGVERLIALSTDKAVYPINAMGQSKALMEKIVVARSRSAGDTVLCATRYGNVMASRGSVIPLFIRQLQQGKDITVTDPTMTRFLMSLDESVDLVLFAYANGEQGDIFVQKAPASTVEVLAQALQRIFGGNSAVKIIGTRHGEKLYETLVAREEMSRADDLGAYYRVPADARDLNYSKFTTLGERSISEAEDYTSHNTRRLNIDEVVGVLERLEYLQQVKAGLAEAAGE